MSPTAAGQYIDYSAYAAQFAAAGAYEAAYPYGTTASAFVTPSGAAYTAYAMPQQIAAGTAAIHFQPQQIQAERMQWCRWNHRLKIIKLRPLIGRLN